MKKIVKFLPLVIAITAIADTQFELLVSIGLSHSIVNYIKLVGLLLTAFLPSLQESLIEPKNEIEVNSEDVQIGKRPKKKGEFDGEELDSVV